MAKEKMSEQLVDLEKTNSDYRDKFEKEVRAMYEKKLRMASRIGLIGLGIVGVFQGFIFYMLAFVVFRIKEYAFLDLAIVEWFSVVGVILCILWLILIGWLLIRGKINLLLHPKLAAILGWLLIVVLMVVTAGLFSVRQGNQEEFSIIMPIYCIVLPLLTLMLLQSGRQERMRLKMQQKILELEFQIAQLRE